MRDEIWGVETLVKRSSVVDAHICGARCQCAAGDALRVGLRVAEAYRQSENRLQVNNWARGIADAAVAAMYLDELNGEADWAHYRDLPVYDLVYAIDTYRTTATPRPHPSADKPV